MQEPDDRQHPRHLAKLTVEVRSELDAMITGSIQDLSMAGIYVLCSQRLPVGTGCEIAIEGADPEGPEWIRAHGRVVHVQLDGMGIQITELDLTDLEELRRLVEARQAASDE